MVYWKGSIYRKGHKTKQTLMVEITSSIVLFIINMKGVTSGKR